MLIVNVHQRIFKSFFARFVLIFVHVTSWFLLLLQKVVSGNYTI